jgi:hypothetical protein
MTAAPTATFPINDLERHRIWLDLVNTTNSLSDRILVGYVEGATNNRDNFYDAETLYTGSMSLFSLIGTDKFLIQGRQLPFNNSDVIPLGVTITTAGKYSIAISALDGLFNDVINNIYLEDKQTEKIQNLKIKPYTFTSSTGTFNNRFRLRFKYKSEDDDEEEDKDKMVANSNEVTLVKSGASMTITSTNETMQSITVFDLIGRELFKTNAIQNTTFTIDDIVRNDQGLIVKIILENGTIITKKALF